MAGRDRKRRGFTSRTKQRNRALDVIFEADEKSLLDEDSLRDLLAQRQLVSTAQVPIGEFGSRIVEAYAGNIDDVDTIVEASSEDWAMSRMNAVDRSILRAGTAELLYIGTERGQLIPEWASLAREFSTDRSVGFVMGILNRVADIRERETSQSGSPKPMSPPTQRHSPTPKLPPAPRPPRNRDAAVPRTASGPHRTPKAPGKRGTPGETPGNRIPSGTPESPRTPAAKTPRPSPCPAARGRRMVRRAHPANRGPEGVSVFGGGPERGIMCSRELRLSSVL